jgi:Family of unknown function (DUF6445)
MTAAQVHYVGAERQPVIQIDEFVPDPQALVDEAASLPYMKIGAHYPGVRALLPPVRLHGFMPGIAELVLTTFDCGTALRPIEAYYSVVTTPPGALTPIQRLPHFDGLERERIALLHFLSTDHASGTAFYRHRSTGFETVDAARYPQFTQALENDVARLGLPDSAYISDDTSIYEQTARFEGRFNRALIYRGHALHCAWLPDELSFSADPRQGRLTVNTFLMGEA